MKKLLITLICFSMVCSGLFAQQRAPRQAPQSQDNPFEAMQQMMQQFSKMFGGSSSSEQGDSTQNFGFQQFNLPFGQMDSTLSKSFGFTFDGNNLKNMFPENGDSTSNQGFQQMQEQLKKMMPGMDFEKLLQGQTPFGGSDPSVVQPMDKKRREEEGKKKKKYETEKL
jgi:hypothetical protein